MNEGKTSVDGSNGSGRVVCSRPGATWRVEAEASGLRQLADSASVNAADIDTYLAQANENAELLFYSYLLLKQAQKGKVDIAALAAQRKDIRGTPD